MDSKPVRVWIKISAAPLLRCRTLFAHVFPGVEMGFALQMNRVPRVPLIVEPAGVRSIVAMQFVMEVKPAQVARRIVERVKLPFVEMRFVREQRHVTRARQIVGSASAQKAGPAPNGEIV